MRTVDEGELDRGYGSSFRQTVVVVNHVCNLGNKKDNITVIYTPWSNLKKDGRMDVGQVGFKDNKKACHALPFGLQII